MSLSSPAACKNQRSKPILLPWSACSFDDLGDNVQLQVEVLQGASAILLVSKQNKLIFRFQPGLALERAIVLEDGNLATMWHGAAGSHGMLHVFGYSHGKIKELIGRGVRGLAPEFVYLSDGPIVLSTELGKDGKRHWAGEIPSYQSVIVPNVAFSSTGALEPRSADIFTWNAVTGKYAVRRNVAWGKRLVRSGRHTNPLNDKSKK